MEIRSLTTDEHKIVEEIVKWHSYPSHCLTADPDQIRTWVENTIRSHGLVAVQRAYLDWGCRAYPSVHKFWQAIKGLKKARQKAQSPADHGNGSVHAH